MEGEVAHYVGAPAANETSQRFKRIKQELLSSPTYLCPERASLITDYFKHHDDPHESMVIRKAKALRYLLMNKSVRIYPDELIVGNIGSHRNSALIQPELSGVFMGTELLWIDKRKTNPLKMPWSDRLNIIFRVYPYWLLRNMPFRAFRPHFRQFLHFALDQLNAT